MARTGYVFDFKVPQSLLPAKNFIGTYKLALEWQKAVPQFNDVFVVKVVTIVNRCNYNLMFGIIF